MAQHRKKLTFLVWLRMLWRRGPIRVPRHLFNPYTVKRLQATTEALEILAILNHELDTSHPAKRSAAVMYDYQADPEMIAEQLRRHLRHDNAWKSRQLQFDPTFVSLSLFRFVA